MIVSDCHGDGDCDDGDRQWSSLRMVVDDRE